MGCACSTDSEQVLAPGSLSLYDNVRNVLGRRGRTPSVVVGSDGGWCLAVLDGLC